jgi:methionyl-tRNA formyltransferase
MTQFLKKPLNLIFMGTPAFAVPCLQTLLNHPEQFNVIGVVTQPDKPSGRGKKLMPPPVKTLAETHNIPIHQPTHLRTDEATMAWLEAQSPDFIVTIAFGQILPKRVLDVPKFGVVNVHASLLPAYRGANPIQWAVFNNEAQTGLTTMFSDEGVDTGMMLLTETLDIARDDTTGSLAEKLSGMAGDLLVKTLTQVAERSLMPTPQPEMGISLAPKFKKEASFLDWTLPAETLVTHIKALTPAPSAVTFFEGNRVKIGRSSVWQSEEFIKETPVGTLLAIIKEGLIVQAGNQTQLCIHQLQPAGKPLMNAADWARNAIATQLTQTPHSLKFERGFSENEAPAS